MKYWRESPALFSHVLAACRGKPRETRHEMFSYLRSSADSGAYLCDEGVIAVFGDAAGPVSLTGHFWMVTSGLETKFPFSLVREGRRECARLLQGRWELHAFARSPSASCMRLYKMIGFQAEDMGGELFLMRYRKWAS